MGFVLSLCAKGQESRRRSTVCADSTEELVTFSSNGGYGVEFLRIVPNLRFEGKELGCGLFQSLCVCRALVVLQMVNCTGTCNFRLLSQIKTLQALCIDGTIKFLNMSAILSLSRLRVLTVENNKTLGDNALPDVGSLEKLETVDISGCSLLTSVKGLQKLPLLFALNLSGTAVTDEFIKELVGCPVLGVIQLLYCKQLTDVSPLGSIATLEIVDISGCTNVKEFGKIWCNPNLQQLGLGNCAITDEIVKDITNSSTLKHLTLNTCAQLTDVSPLKSMLTLEIVLLDFCKGVKKVGFMGTLPKLGVLSVAGTSVEDEDIKELGTSHSLVKLFLTQCELITDISPLASIQTLEEVSVFGCEALKNISSIGTSSSLKAIYVNNNTSADSIVEELSKIRENVKVVVLYPNGKTSVKDVQGSGKLTQLALVLAEEPPLF